MKFQKRVLSFLGVLSTLFLFSCGEKKENIYLECSYRPGEGPIWKADPRVFITIDLENMTGTNADHRSSMFGKEPLSISERFYSFEISTGWFHRKHIIDRRTLELLIEVQFKSKKSGKDYRNELSCKKVQSFNKI